MKNQILLAAALLGAATLGFAAEKKSPHAGHDAKAPAPAAKTAGALVSVTEKDAAWAAKARKDYPLEVCIASDEKLGSMGDGSVFIWRAEGKTDRLVIFCCEGCVDDFKGDPAKYLKKLDTAAAAKAKAAGKKA